MILSIPSFAQTKVSGTVYDQDKQPVAFANVMFKNSSEGVISDIDGRFLLQSENNHSTIVVSFHSSKNSKLREDRQHTADLFFEVGKCISLHKFEPCILRFLFLSCSGRFLFASSIKFK